MIMMNDIDGNGVYDNGIGRDYSNNSNDSYDDSNDRGNDSNNTAIKVTTRTTTGINGVHSYIC